MTISTLRPGSRDSWCSAPGPGRTACASRLPAGWSVRTVGRAEADVAARRRQDRRRARRHLSSMPRPTPPWTRPKASPSRLRGQPRRRRPCGAGLCPPASADPHVHRLCLRRPGGRSAYREDDPVDPLSVYGASKAAGEKRCARRRPPRHRPHVLGLRPARPNFVRTMLRLGRGTAELGSSRPARLPDLGRRHRRRSDRHGGRMAQPDAIGGADLFGTFHFAAPGDDMAGFAQAILREAARLGRPAAAQGRSRPLISRPRRRGRSIRCWTAQAARVTDRRPPWRETLATCIGRLWGASRLRPVSWARHEGHHPGRRLGTRLYPVTRASASSSCRLRQADDLLPARDADARGHPRHPDHLHAARSAQFQRLLGDGSQWGSS